MPQEYGIDIGWFDPCFLNSFPNDLAWYENRFGYRPYDNEVLSLSIGQGPITMTVLKLAHIYAALTAPGGKVPAPRLAMESGAPRDTFTFKLDAVDQWYLEAGMRRVVGPDLGVKASGGVRSRQDALAMIEAGATRIGASSALAILGTE